jgi:hypothetical protein
VLRRRRRVAGKRACCGSGRNLERLEGVVALDAAAAGRFRFGTERHYSWVEDYMEWMRGKEKRTEYHALLEEELASLRG